MTVNRTTPEALIMLAHVKLSAVDPEHLASCSRAVATDLLRTRWGHRGLLITDDFTMLPVWHAPGGLDAAVVRALNAGVDLILISADTQQVYLALAALLQADRVVALDGVALAASRARLAYAVTGGDGGAEQRAGAHEQPIVHPIVASSQLP